MKCLISCFGAQVFKALITIYNVNEFGKMSFIYPLMAKLDRDRVVTAYEVSDKPLALKAEDWDWVVVVFVLLRFSIRVSGTFSSKVLIALRNCYLGH